MGAVKTANQAVKVPLRPVPEIVQHRYFETSCFPDQLVTCNLGSILLFRHQLGTEMVQSGYLFRYGERPHEEGIRGQTCVQLEKPVLLAYHGGVNDFGLSHMKHRCNLYNT